MDQATVDHVNAELGQYTGTDKYYRTFISPRVTYTDGVKYFAGAFGAYWLLDILASELVDLTEKHEILFLKIKVAARKEGGMNRARITATTNGIATTIVWSKNIKITDLPVGEWAIWMGTGGPGGAVVIFLPSEY